MYLIPIINYHKIFHIILIWLFWDIKRTTIIIVLLVFFIHIYVFICIFGLFRLWNLSFYVKIFLFTCWLYIYTYSFVLFSRKIINIPSKKSINCYIFLIYLNYLIFCIKNSYNKHHFTFFINIYVYTYTFGFLMLLSETTTINYNYKNYIFFMYFYTYIRMYVRFLCINNNYFLNYICFF